MSRAAWTYAAADSVAASPATSPAAPHPGTAASAALSARPHTAIRHTASEGDPLPAADSLAAADTLAGTPVPDSPAGLFAADRTPAEILFLPTPEEMPHPWRDTTGEAVFGRESILVPPEKLQRPETVSFTDNALFQGFVLLLAAMYAMLLYRNIGDIRTLFSHISREASSRQRLTEDPGSSGFSRFLHVVTAIGMLFLGIFAVKYGDTLLPQLLGRLPHGILPALSLLAALACAAILAFQTLLLRCIGSLLVAEGFIARLRFLRRTYFALAVIVTAPVLLLFALCPRNTGDVWFLIITIELAVTAVLYLRESLHLFISKKISILNWILYLCTVEIFPASLVWLLLAR